VPMTPQKLYYRIELRFIPRGSATPVVGSFVIGRSAVQVRSSAPAFQALRSGPYRTFSLLCFKPIAMASRTKQGRKAQGIARLYRRFGCPYSLVL
jgi:hypothetical protein